MASRKLKEYVDNLRNIINSNGLKLEYIDAMRQAGIVGCEQEKDVEYGIKVLEYAKDLTVKFVKANTNGTVWQLEKYCMDNRATAEVITLFYNILKAEAPYRLEAFIFFMEKNRKQEKRFYMPRRKTLKIVVNDLQDLEDGKYKFYGLSMPSRTGKSTICIFFLAWLAFIRPNSHSAMGGHSGMLADGFYDELLNLFTSDDYTFKELFESRYPGHKLLQDKSAENHTITLDEPDRFATITCRGIDGTWTGAIDISGGDNPGYLYVDDLVRDREHSLSPQRMENTYQEYLNKMVDRKNDGSRELMVGTLWNVLDPLERMRKEFEGNPEYFFRKIPALNENDESNFDYTLNGFSTQYYRDMRERMYNAHSEAEWMAKFQQAPYVREGIVFQPDELRYFNGILPEGEFRIVAAVDVAWGGGDSTSMPIGAMFENGDVYVIAWIFNNGSKEITIPLVTNAIISNNIHQITFEANNGGEMYQAYIDEKLLEQGYKCSTESRKAPTRVSKLDKILQYEGDIKTRFIFLGEHRPTPKERENDAKNGIKRYYRNDEYQKAMEEFCTFVKVGKNAHDDAVDGVTQLAMNTIEEIEQPECKAMVNPFRGYWRK